MSRAEYSSSWRLWKPFCLSLDFLDAFFGCLFADDRHNKYLHVRRPKYTHTHSRKHTQTHTLAHAHKLG